MSKIMASRATNVVAPDCCPCWRHMWMLAARVVPLTRLHMLAAAGRSVLIPAAAVERRARVGPSWMRILMVCCTQPCLWRTRAGAVQPQYGHFELHSREHSTLPKQYSFTAKVAVRINPAIRYSYPLCGVAGSSGMAEYALSIFPPSFDCVFPLPAGQPASPRPDLMIHWQRFRI